MPVLAMAAPDPDQRPALTFDEADCITDLGHSAPTSDAIHDELPHRLPVRAHEVTPVFTVSRSTLAGLNVGAVEASTATGSPVRGLRAVRAGRARVANWPNPAILTSSRRPSASVTASNTASTAPAASVRLGPAQAATSLTISDLFMRSLPEDLPGCTSGRRALAWSGTS